MSALTAVTHCVTVPSLWWRFYRKNRTSVLVSHDTNIDEIKHIYFLSTCANWIVNWMPLFEIAYEIWNMFSKVMSTNLTGREFYKHFFKSCCLYKSYFHNTSFTEVVSFQVPSLVRLEDCHVERSVLQPAACHCFHSVDFPVWSPARNSVFEPLFNKYIHNHIANCRSVTVGLGGMGVVSSFYFLSR